MKKLVLASLLFPISIFAQPGFSETLIDSAAAAIGVSSMATGDFNNDGFEDLATSHSFSDEIAVYLKNGFGGYGPRQLVTDTPDYPVDIAVADFDGNGWPDIASVSQQDQYVAWYPNQNGNFGGRQLIDSGFFFAVALVASDFNNDGFVDLVSVDDTIVRLHLNDGLGNFTSSKISGESEFYSIGVADINGDSLPDVMLGSTGLYTYINNGDGTFTRDTRNESLILNFVFEIELGDLDGDGDQDMAIYYANNISDIDWYKNDGTGKFTLANSITNTSNDVKSMTLTDLDKDGDLDFLTAYGQSGELVWMENDGAGNFSNEILIKTYPVLLRQVAATDADHDGDIDIFCGHNNEGLFYWENQLPIAVISENAITAKLYPNPAQNHVCIQTSSPGTLQVFDLHGTKVNEQHLDTGENELHLKFSKGVYILRWTDGDNVFSQKLLLE